ncbi:MAG: GntR family transcriptional regulator [Oscillospiraceae bacterium]|nr:GntR family transcriptional regulator [Oscillospiraceae bacterium]
MFVMQLEGGAPIYEQLVTRITELISNGTLAENEKLPAVREVAKALGVNPNTVQKAYAMLEQSGLIYSIPAKGSYVGKAEKTEEIIKRKILTALSENISDALKAGIQEEEIMLIIKNMKEEISND